MNYCCIMDGNEYMVRMIDGHILATFLLDENGVIRKKVNPTDEMVREFLHMINDNLALDCEKEDEATVAHWAKNFFACITVRYRYFIVSGHGTHIFVSIDTPVLNENGEYVFKQGMDITSFVPLDVFMAAKKNCVIERGKDEV